MTGATRIGLWIVVLGAAAWPILAVGMPPGADSLNHLARAVILHRLPDDAILQGFYAPAWAVLPNLAFDAVVIPALHFLSPHAAGKAFYLLSMLLMFAGTAALRRQIFGHAGSAPMVVILVLYNAPLAIGLANFYFGLGALMLALAIWMRHADWSPIAQATTVSISAAVLFLTHMMIAGCFLAAIAAIRLEQHLTDRRRLAAIDWINVLPLLVVASLWSLVPAAAHGTETAFGGLRGRFEVLISPVLSFSDFDPVLAAVLAALLIWLFTSRRIRLKPPLRLCIIGLIAVSLLVPVKLFGVWLTHVRLPVLAALLLIAAVDVRIPEVRLRYFLVMALVVFSVIKLERAVAAIAGCDQRRQEIAAAFRPLAPGTRLLPIWDEAASPGVCLNADYWHMPAAAVIEGRAFTPLLFTSMQPLRFQAPYGGLMQGVAQPVGPAIFSIGESTLGEAQFKRRVAENWRRDFDVVVWLHPGLPPPAPTTPMHLIVRGSFFTLFRIEPMP